MQTNIEKLLLTQELDWGKYAELKSDYQSSQIDYTSLSDWHMDLVNKTEEMEWEIWSLTSSIQEHEDNEICLKSSVSEWLNNINTLDEEMTATKKQNSGISHDLMKVQQSIVELKNDLELEKIKVTGQTKLVEEKN